MDIKEKIEFYKKKKEEIRNIKEEINRQYNDFDKFMQPQKDYLKKKELELNNCLTENVIKVRLGDVVDKLALKTNQNRDDIIYNVKINMYTEGKKSLEYFKTNSKGIHYNYNSSPYAIITFFSNRENGNYILECPINFNEIQADNKKFIDHCSVKTYPDFNRLIGSKTYIEVDKDIDDIMINIEISHLNNSIIIDILNDCINENNKVKKIGGIK